MLNYEEKKAIDYLKARLYGNESCKFIDVAQSDLRIFLNLVEKQQKQIEKLEYEALESKEYIKTLKEKIKNFTIEDEKIFIQFGEIIEKKRWKNKIKAKIEELKDGTYDAKIVLFSLLEKE